MKALLLAMLLLPSTAAFAADSASTSAPTAQVLPAPAMAPTPAEAPKPAVVAKVDDDKVKCQMERVLGSNRSKRVCTTAKQREEAREAARAQMENSQRER